MKRKNIVTIGGGTGSFTLLTGLKKHPVNLSAIVSMADDGGSTGVLRDELGVLPPGDIRQCLVALSDSSEMLRKLMNYRFEKGGLKGHNFGNLFLSALEKITGNFSEGVLRASKILNVKGSVIPVTNHKATLRIRLKNGKILNGEDEINHGSVQKIGVKKMYFGGHVKANLKALKAIRDADVIVIGPGNHYCSILPNFLIKEFSAAIKKAKAMVIYNVNLTNKHHHTEGFTVNTYISAIEQFIGKGRIDYATFNIKKPSGQLMRRYIRHEGKDLLVRFGEKKNAQRSFTLVKGNFIGSAEIKQNGADAISDTRSFIRHDPHRLATAIMYIVQQKAYKNVIKEII